MIHLDRLALRSGTGAAGAAIRAAAGLLVVLSLALAHPAAAQESDPEPLTKSEIIRLLSGTTYTDSEIEGIVRRSCLSFEPTDRDWESFRELGAGEELISAIRDCGDEQSELRLALDAPRVEAAAGDTVSIRAEVRAADEPRPGVRLSLREGDGGAEASGPEPRATTDSSGTAVFRIEAGRGVGTRQLRIEAPDARLTGETGLTLVTLPGRPARAELRPDRLELSAGNGDAHEVGALVRDRFGNPVPGVELGMHADASGAGDAVDTGTTDERGRATLRVPEDTGSERQGTYALVSGDEVLATLPVSAPATVAAGEPTQGESRPERDEGADEPDVGQVSDASVAGSLERANAALRNDRPGEAARRFESAARRSPGNPDAWLGLGKARVDLRQEREARRAFRRVLEIDPENEDAREALDDLTGFPAFLELTAWGGDEFSAERGAGLRFARATLEPESGLRVWAEYDDALHLNRPALVRGRDQVKGWFAGGSLDWGPGEALGPFTTKLEIGRRTFSELVQNYYRVEQGVRLSPAEMAAGAPSIRAAIGAMLGRRFDRDDWQLYARLQVPAGRDLIMTSSLHFGETLGTDTRETGRRSERERRVRFALDYRPLPSVSIEPSIGAGRVESELDEFSGLLMEGGLRLEVPVTRSSRGELFLRHQAPPGTPSFTVLGLGFRVGIDR